MIKKLSVVLVLVLVSGSLWAQSEVDGVWNFSMSSPMGAVAAKVVLVTDGSSLTGEFDLGGGRKWPIEEGSVNGSSVRFKLNRDGASMTYVMSANIDGDSAIGSADAMGTTVEWTMTRAD